LVFVLIGYEVNIIQLAREKKLTGLIFDLPHLPRYISPEGFGVDRFGEGIIIRVPDRNPI